MPHRVIANCAIVFAAVLLAATGTTLLAQDVVLEAPPGMDNGMVPMTHYGEGNYFSQDLGTMLRLRFNTEGYGQTGRGNFDIGTMQVWSLDSSAAFFDGQVTLNELQGVGYNFGLGYRALTNPGISRGAGRMNGVSFWTDGQSTNEGNFFPQIGLSLESLGDMWDVRANGYLPLGPDSQIGEFTPTGVTGLQGNSIAELTQAVLNTSYAVADLEMARRLGSERDAWAFAGPYFVGNDDDDSVGYRVGMRGYAYPDLLLQIAVTDDEIFKTNAAFSVTWFVGRTRTDFQPTCGVPDRLREPVLRNDYVALSQSFVQGGIPLTRPDGTALRLVHVDSDAGEGGDGTFENPFNNLTDINGAGSLADDVILAHALSIFDSEGSVELKDGQRLLGEGNGVEHTVVTLQDGTVIIPETFAGARTSARPQLLGPAPGSDAIILANANEVNNFTIDGQDVTQQAIASPGGGSGNPVLRNLTISNTLGDAIHLTPLAEVDSDDSDNDGNVTETFVRGNVTIADVTFNSIGEDDIDIDAATIDVTLPNVTLQEVISITNIASTNNQGRSIAIANTHAQLTGQPARSATINNFTYDGGANSLAGIVLTNFDSTFSASNTTLTGGNITGSGVEVLGDSDGTMTFASTVVFNNVTGTAFLIDGIDGIVDALGGTVTVNGPITNTIGQSVIVRNVGANANIDFNANITDSGSGILIEQNSGGTITFATGTIDLDIDTLGVAGVQLTDNTGATIEFLGPVDITSTLGADGLIATGGGTFRYSNTANSIGTDTGQVVRITDMIIQSPNGVVISDVNRTAAAATAAIFLEDNTGAGIITLGNVADAAPGDSGTLNGGIGANTVVINDSANVTMSNIIIQNGTDGTGILIEKMTTPGTQTINLNDLIVNDGDRGINVVGGAGAAALNLTVSDNQILDSTELGVAFDDVDSGTIAFVNTDVDGNNVTAGARGVLINDSNASFNFDGNSSVADFLGTTFQVNDGLAGTTSSGPITFAGDIINNGAGDTSGRSVVVQQLATGGTVNFTSVSLIDDTNEGILVQNNTGGTVSFLGDNNLNTDENTAVTINSNTGATIRLSNLDIDTDEGNGFVATGGGTLEVTTTAGTTNTITTADGAGAVLGVGLQIEDMIIGAGGVTFQEIDVTDGDARGIVLSDLTGGAVTIGTLAGNTSDLTTAGDAIVLENVANVDLLNVQVVSAGGIGVNVDHSSATNMDVTINNLNLVSSTGLGIEVDHSSSNLFNLRLIDSEIFEQVDMDITGSGQFVMLVDNTDVTTGGTNVAFDLAFSGSSADGDVTIRNTSSFTAVDAQALLLTVDGVGRSIEVNIDDNTFTNNSATFRAAELLASGGGLLNATVVNNDFINPGTEEELLIESDDPATVVNLKILNNGPLGADLRLREVAGDFNVVNVATADANNDGDIIFEPNIAAFDDIPVPPEPGVELPVLPP